MFFQGTTAIRNFIKENNIDCGKLGNLSGQLASK